MKKDFLLDICINALVEDSEDQEDFDHKLEKIVSEDMLTDLYKALIEEIPKDVVGAFLETCEKYYKEAKKEEAVYRRHLDEIWEKGFELTNALYEMVIEEVADFSSRITKEHGEDIKGKEYKVKVLQLISNRNLQTFDAIFCLIKNGFGDQAFMLFRNMFENWVVSKFIFLSNEATAKEFYFLQKEGVDNFSDYNWARKSGKFKEKERITFKSIYNKCEFKNPDGGLWYKQYRMACKLLHTTPIGTTHSLAVASNEKEELPLVGQSPYGLNIAAEHSALMLVATVTNYLGLIYDESNLVFIKILNKWVEKISTAYTEIAEGMDENEASNDDEAVK